MTIGIDISSLQGPHRMRGIGYTLINLINNISKEDRRAHKFVFYAYTDDRIQEVLDLLDLAGLDYELRPLEQPRRITKTLPGQLRLMTVLLNQISTLKATYYGDPRIKSLEGIDAFLQTDQAISVPSGRGIKKALILYDLIPYILEWDYMWSYRTARLNSFSRRAALRCAARRRMFAFKTRLNCRRADVLLAISHKTKNDFAHYLSVKADKIQVVPLGVNPPGRSTKAVSPSRHYIATSWGYAQRPLHLPADTRFLLFVGGADGRRKLGDLVVAFNHLRAQGENLKLILAGDIMQGPNNIPLGSARTALNTSSYYDDILFLGFVSDAERDWLYDHALAFVFPSRYEGFGLPVLEAMSYGCPTVCYPNAATVEVAGNASIYAENALELEKAIKPLILDGQYRANRMGAGKRQAEDYSWAKTTTSVLGALAR